jgi:hypothetical protein
MAHYAEETESGEDVVHRVWVKKSQQAADALSESRRLMQDYGQLYTAEEHRIWTEACQRMEDVLSMKDLPLLIEQFEALVAIILPFVERYLAHILNQKLGC